MSAASNYLEQQLINHVLGRASYTMPAKTYVSLHTAGPGETGAGEVSTSVYPAYTRIDAALGGSQSSAWIAPSDGVSKNALQLIWPMYDGAGPLTITHFGVWDAPTGGNYLFGAPLASSRTVNPSDVFVADAQKLTAQVL